VIAGVALVALHALSGARAKERALLSTISIAMLAALPLVILFAPKLSVALPEPVPTSLAAAVLTPADEAPLSPTASLGEVTEPFEAVTPVSESVPGAAMLAELLPGLALTAYLVIAALFLINLGSGLAGLKLWTARSRTVRSGFWNDQMRQAADRMGVRRTTRLLVTDEACPPVSFGVIRPTILIDETALARGEDAAAILSHEMAHIARLDWPVLVAAKVVRALFWFNPLVWTLARRLEDDMEEAADALAVTGMQRTAYAEALLNAARDRQMPCLANGAGSSSLERRVTRLFEGAGAASPRTAAALVALSLGIAGPVAALQVGPDGGTGTGMEDDIIESVSVPGEGRPDAPLTAILDEDTRTDERPLVEVVAVQPVPPEGNDNAFAGEVSAELEREWAAADARIDLSMAETEREVELAEHAVALAAAAMEAAAAEVERRSAVTLQGYRRLSAKERKARETELEEAMGKAHAKLERAGKTLDTKVRTAMKRVQKDLARAARDMERGADDMDRGADELEREADLLSDPSYRRTIIAKQARQGYRVTDADLIDAVAELRRGAQEMREGAMEMREGSDEMRESIRDAR
jgi:beta-lactamase regulating signal transducer with metallopeptidase domain